MFSEIVAAIYLYMALFTGSRGIYASKLASQYNLAKINPERLRVFFCNNQTASSY